MSDSYFGEIRLFAGTYAPENWLFCDGSLLPIAGNEPLFALIGTTYGGDGVKDFALPDLRGRLPVGQGQGPGLSNRVLGQQDGAASVTLSVAQIPPHNHMLKASPLKATQNTPAQYLFLGTAVPDQVLYFQAQYEGNEVILSQQTIGNTGNNEPHDNLMPSMAINFIICKVGFYPVDPNK